MQTVMTVALSTVLQALDDDSSTDGEYFNDTEPAVEKKYSI